MQEIILLINVELLILHFIMHDVLTNFPCQLSVQAVDFCQFLRVRDIFFLVLLFLPDFSQSMPNLAENVPIGGSTKNLYHNYYHNFELICGQDISIPDSQHGGRGEINWVKVLAVPVFVIRFDAVDPVVFGVKSQWKE